MPFIMTNPEAQIQDHHHRRRLNFHRTGQIQDENRWNGGRESEWRDFDEDLDDGAGRVILRACYCWIALISGVCDLGWGWLLWRGRDQLQPPPPGKLRGSNTCYSHFFLCIGTAEIFSVFESLSLIFFVLVDLKK